MKKLGARKLILLCAIIGLACSEKQRPVEIYEIPDGYVGWVRVDYGQASCRNPSGPMLVRNDGRACSLSNFREGSAMDEFYYVGSRGRQPIGDGEQLILNRTYNVRRGADGLVVERYQEFFVGTREQLKAQAPSPWSPLRVHGRVPDDQTPTVKE